MERPVADCFADRRARIGSVAASTEPPLLHAAALGRVLVVASAKKRRTGMPIAQRCGKPAADSTPVSTRTSREAIEVRTRRSRSVQGDPQRPPPRHDPTRRRSRYAGPRYKIVDLQTGVSSSSQAAVWPGRIRADVTPAPPLAAGCAGVMVRPSVAKAMRVEMSLDPLLRGSGQEVQTATTAHGRQGDRCLPARSRRGIGGVAVVSGV